MNDVAIWLGFAAAIVGGLAAWDQRRLKKRFKKDHPGAMTGKRHAKA